MSNSDNGKPRECGSCKLCCELLELPELNKPEYVLCGKYDNDAKACSIYGLDSRPKACKDFRCGWLSDTENFPSYARPDKVGFFCTMLTLGGIDTILYMEKISGVATQHFEELIKRQIINGYPVLIRNRGITRRLCFKLSLHRI